MTLIPRISRFLPQLSGISFRQAGLVLLSIMLLFTAGCAKRPPASDPQALTAYLEANDPLEPMNRAIFSFNQGFDRILLAPAARLYRQFGPPDIRDGISNFVSNWREPVTFVNDVLQGEAKRAGTTLTRFLINSTFGLLGILDTATYWGIEHHSEDFGETFAVWGFGEGFYLMLPILGPSNARDFAGFTVDFFYDPVSLWLSHKGWTYVRYGRLALRGLIYREENLETLDDLGKSSTDFYATIRSAYRQNRNYEINNGKLDTGADDDLFDDNFDDENF
ncbi:VacJ family lipoprotein [Paremcibacter congregatus]|uniref:MlaA family lipoprotein n=1 Tax=Paremcibacter congregatus TaxID=2043170 RepID=UPI0030EC6CE9|tara:strand:+ start:2419 stop:3252 length:834 start_codon:yes stop_codon:yes gene_type:complete